MRGSSNGTVKGEETKFKKAEEEEEVGRNEHFGAYFSRKKKLRTYRMRSYTILQQFKANF